MTEYGYDIWNMKVYQDEELTLEFDTSNLTREDWEKIIGGIPIVRCKDCDYTDESLDEDHDYWCLHHGIYIDADDYCSRGERRTE